MDEKAKYGLQGGVRAAELQPLGLGIGRIDGDADGSAPVTLRVGQVDRGFETGHKAFVGVGGRCGKGQKGRGVLEKAADVVKGHFAQSGETGSCEEGGIPLPEALMDVHARPVVIEQGFGHEGSGLAVLFRDVLNDVFIEDELVCTGEEGGEPEVDFTLSPCGHLMMVGFDVYATLDHRQHHFAAYVLKGVRGRYGEISLFVSRLITEVGIFVFPRVPSSFNRIDVVVSTFVSLIEAGRRRR